MKIEALLRDRTKLAEEMKTIAEGAKNRGNLSRRDAAKFDELEAQIADFDSLIREAQAAEGEGYAPLDRSVVRGKSESAVLAPEDRMADYVAERRGFFPGESSLDPDEFSLGRIVRAAVTGERKHLTDAERRAMGEGSDATGGVLIPEILAASVIDRARAKSVAMAAGAVTLPMDSDKTVIARLDGGNTAIWHAENASDITASDQVWERVELAAKTVVTEQKLSRELFEDLDASAHSAIVNEIAQTIALAFDFAVFEGVAPAPVGIDTTSGVGTVSMGTNGAVPDSYAEIVRAVYAVLKENGSDPTALVAHPRDLESYALLADTTGQPLRRPDAIANLPFLSTTQLATDRDQGSSTDVCSNAYVGDFRNVILGVRPSLQIRLMTLQERYATPALQVGLLAYLRVDVAIARPEHLVKIVGLKAA
jgi:HK97 family phage major capsid protein